jgi:hypothetical protein
MEMEEVWDGGAGGGNYIEDAPGWGTWKRCRRAKDKELYISAAHGKEGYRGYRAEGKLWRASDTRFPRRLEITGMLNHGEGGRLQLHAM